MNEFDDIRPYRDDEVRPTLDRLIKNNEFIDVLAKLKSPTVGRLAGSLVRPLVRSVLKKELTDVNSVDAFQDKIEPYVTKTIKNTTAGLTISGLENLDKNGTHCFISNHRDIVMDPACVNWTLYHNNHQTLRIAIGDNLLTKPFASDLMRLNKSFIVNRSASAPREKFKAAKHLSSYIHHSIINEGANIWIAQREGRAKDGLDITNPAIISMLAMNKAKKQDLSEYLQQLNVVPISISYEYDPCDEAKAREITIIAKNGSYEKAEHEDVKSIATGISGFKGRVHLSFGKPLVDGFETTDDVAKILDATILENYILHPSNCIAYQLLTGEVPNLPVTDKQIPFSEYGVEDDMEKFKERLQSCPEPYRDAFLKNYANPVSAKLAAAKENKTECEAS